MMQPVCQKCNQPIVGNYITALGASWHPEHFVCTNCGRPIMDNQFRVRDNTPYHEECYIQRIAHRCTYCSKPLIGEYLVDYWGERYCKEHEQAPKCVYCSRIVAPGRQKQTPAGLCCPVCYASAIETVEEALPLFAQVKRWVSQQGLVYNNLSLSLELCDRAKLLRLTGGRGAEHSLGVTIGTMYTQDGQTTHYEVKGVGVLHALPAILFQGVAVHELGHVWMIVHGINDLPLWAEEGFCELLANRYYASINTPESKYHILAQERKDDSIYSVGLQRVRKIAEKVGFARIVETLRTTRKLPA